jgi:tetratricopeptide (TPR) repeat protein
METTKQQIVRRWNLLFIVLLIVVCVALAAGLHLLHRFQASRLSVDHRVAAMEHYENGEYEDALAYLGHVLQRNPNDREAALAYARSVSQLERPSPQQRLGQLSQYRRAIALDPTDREVAEEGLELYVRNDLWLEAREIAGEILAVEPDSRIARLVQARISMREGLLDEAETLLTTLAEEFPADDATLAEYARLLRTRSRDETLIRRSETIQLLGHQIERAVTAHGEENPRLYLIRADHYLQEGGGSTLARQDYERALDLAPEDPEVCAAAGRFYLSVGEFDEALKWIGIAIDADPRNHDNYIQLAQAYVARGRFPDAIEVLERGVEAAPEGGVLLSFYLAETLLSNGETERARELVETLNRASLPFGLTSYLRARLFLADGRPGRAIATLETITDPSILPLVRYMLAQAYLELGEPQRARAILSQLPEGQIDPLMRGRLELQVFAATGRYDELLAQSGEILDELPDDPELLFLKAEGLLGLIASGDATQAQRDELVRVYQQLAISAGSDVRVQLLKSRIDQFRGRTQDAIWELDAARKENQLALELYAELVRLHLEEGNAEAALQVLGEAPEEAKQKAQYRVLLARTYEETGETEQAVAALRDGLEEMEPTDRRTIRQILAALLRKHDRVDEAIDELRQISRDEPDDINVRRSMLAYLEVQADPALRDALIDEIRAAEERLGDDGAAWRLEKARSLLLDQQEADAEEALRLLVEVRDLRPNWEEALHLQALAAKELGRYEEAAEYAERAIEVQPDLQVTKLLLVDLYTRLDEGEKVDQLIAELNEIRGPLPVPFLNRRLNRNLDLGQTSSAAEDVKRLLVASPDNAEMRALLARLLGASGELEEAVEEAKRALEQDPTSLNVAVTLLQQALEVEDYDLAMEAVAAVEAAHPGSETPYLMRVDIYTRQGETDKVLEEFRRGSEATGAAAITLAHARFMRDQGRVQEALALYDAVDPEFRLAPMAALEAAELMLDSDDDPDRAAAKIAQAERLGAPKLQLNAMRVRYLDATKPVGWLSRLASILEETSRLPDAGPEVFLELSRVYEAQGLTDRAAEVARIGADRFTSHIGINEQYGRMLLLRGDHDEARIQSSRLASLDGGDVSSRLLQVNIHQREQNFQPAAILLRTLISTYPDDPRVQTWRHRQLDLLERMNDLDAVANVIEAVPVDERDDGLHERWAVHLLRERGAPAAIEYLEQRVAAADESTGLYFVLARMWLSVPEPERDAERFMAAVEADRRLHPNSGRSALLMAEEARQRGDSRRAVELYRESLRLDPENLLAVNNLAWTLATEEGRLAEGIRVLEGGLAMDPSNAALLRTYGLLLVDARRWSDAVSVWEELARREHTNVWLKLRIAEARLQLGEAAAARRAWNDAGDIISILPDGIEELDEETRQLHAEIRGRMASAGG